MAVFITEDMHEELARITDPTEKITWLAEHVKTPATLHQYGVLKVASRAKFYGAAAEGALTVIDVIFKAIGWQTMLEAEAKALKFQKTRVQDIRDGLGTALLVGAMATGVGNVVKAYGTWRNVYAMGLGAPRTGGELVEKAIMALRIGGVLIAAISGMAAVLDLGDGIKSRAGEQWALMALQLFSGAAGIVSAIFGAWAAWAEGGALFLGMSLTGWGLILAVVSVALAMIIDKVKGDSSAQWLEHSYWGTLSADDRYASSVSERNDFNKLMAGT